MRPGTGAVRRGVPGRPSRWPGSPSIGLDALWDGSW